MKRRIRIPMKLAIAASPLVLTVGMLLTLTVRAGLDDAARQQRSAQIVDVWSPLNETVDAVDRERGRIGVTDTTGTNAGATDVLFGQLEAVVAALGSPRQVQSELTQAARGLVDARTRRATAGPLDTVAFDDVITDLTHIGDLLPALAADESAGRDLQALSSLFHARQGVSRVSAMIALAVKGEPIDPLGLTLVIEANRDAVSGFVGAAPVDWLQALNASDVPTVLSRSEDAYLSLLQLDPADVPGVLARTDLVGYRQSGREITKLFDTFAASIISDAQARESAATRSSLMQIGAASIAVLLSVLFTWLVTRSITKRIRKVSIRAREVSTTQLPNLVEALRDPRGRSAVPQAEVIEGAGSDEVGELAASFNAMQVTLVEVAEEQIAVLRRGVSDIFVTLARRNRSLVDRQLGLLDRLEADVDDPKVLADYFKLDHLATRMRRNAESLLVLAHTETRHRRIEPLGIDDVVRAAISEVEDYQRIDVLSMEPLTLRGQVVADLSHMLAELIDNAASFSPPTSKVRVVGHFTTDGYLLAITDQGMGISTDRVAELNDLLATPPVIGLSVEATLGLSVVSLLAHKHGVRVTLVPGSPGVAVQVLLVPQIYSQAVEATDSCPATTVAATPAAFLAELTASLAEPLQATATSAGVRPSSSPARVGLAAGGMAPLRVSAQDRLAVELALTAPTPAPRLLRVAESPVSAPVDDTVVPAVAGTASGDVAIPAPSVPRLTPLGLPTRPVDTAPAALPVRPVAPAADVPADASVVASADAPVTAALPPAAVPTPSVLFARVAGTASAVGRGSPPPEVLSLGRPLLEHRSTAAGLPLRVPGLAGPAPTEDERSVSTGRPDQVRANLAAFARGMSAASTRDRSVLEAPVDQEPRTSVFEGTPS